MLNVGRPAAPLGQKALLAPLKLVPLTRACLPTRLRRLDLGQSLVRLLALRPERTRGYGRRRVSLRERDGALVPCYQVTGTTTATISGIGSMQVTDATVTYQNNLFSPGMSAIAPVHVFPDIQLGQVSAQANWNISGGDSSGWYTGGGHYTAGAANCTLDILQGVLSGGPSYRGYIGCGDPDDGTQITYTYHYIDGQGIQLDEPETVDAWRFLDVDLAVDFNGKSYPVKTDGSLSASGSYTYSWGEKDSWKWDFTGQ